MSDGAHLVSTLVRPLVNKRAQYELEAEEWADWCDEAFFGELEPWTVGVAPNDRGEYDAYLLAQAEVQLAEVEAAEDQAEAARLLTVAVHELSKRTAQRSQSVDRDRSVTAAGACGPGLGSIGVGILGSGIMGSGIVEVATKTRREVTFRCKMESANAMVASLEKSLATQVDQGRLTDAERLAVLGRVPARSSPHALPDPDLLVESVTEDLISSLQAAQAIQASRERPFRWTFDALLLVERHGVRRALQVARFLLGSLASATRISRRWLDGVGRQGPRAVPKDPMAPNAPPVPLGSGSCQAIVTQELANAA